jgi:hypothetical protein
MTRVAHVTRPNETISLFIAHLRVGEPDLGLQRLKGAIIEPKVMFECLIRQAFPGAEEGQHLIEDLVQIHRLSSAGVRDLMACLPSAPYVVRVSQREPSREQFLL